MAAITSQRPGVYSQYDVSSAYAAPRGLQCAAVVAKAVGGTVGEVYEIGSQTALLEAFGADTGDATMRGCVQILLQCGVSKIYAVPVADDYAAALGLIGAMADIGAVVCDCADEAGRAALLASVQTSSQDRCERIGFCGCAAPTEAERAAAALNNERIVLSCPAAAPAAGGIAHPAYGATALAGMLLCAEGPTWNFSGEALTGLAEPQRLTESEVQSLLTAGVTVIEQNGAQAQCVRALTTRTKTNGETDYTLRGLNAILCIDNVLTTMRSSLAAVLRGRRLAGSALDSVRSQVVVVLADRRNEGIIEAYEAPVVSLHTEDPTVCVVELAFTVAQVLSQILVTAHIQI